LDWTRGCRGTRPRNALSSLLTTFVLTPPALSPGPPPPLPPLLPFSAYLLSPKIRSLRGSGLGACRYGPQPSQAGRARRLWRDARGGAIASFSPPSSPLFRPPPSFFNFLRLASVIFLGFEARSHMDEPALVSARTSPIVRPPSFPPPSLPPSLLAYLRASASSSPPFPGPCSLSTPLEAPGASFWPGIRTWESRNGPKRKYVAPPPSSSSALSPLGTVDSHSSHCLQCTRLTRLFPSLPPPLPPSFPIPFPLSEKP